MDETVTFHGTPSSGVLMAASTSPPHHQNPISRRYKEIVALQDGVYFPVDQVYRRLIEQSSNAKEI
jgi:hypothetical protein